MIPESQIPQFSIFSTFLVPGRGFFSKVLLYWGLKKAEKKPKSKIGEFYSQEDRKNLGYMFDGSYLHNGQKEPSKADLILFLCTFQTPQAHGYCSCQKTLGGTKNCLLAKWHADGDGGGDEDDPE